MDTAGVRRAVHEATVAGVVVVVVACCGLVVAAALVSPWLSGWGESLASACLGVSPPQVVVDDMIAVGHEGSGATATRSWLPYGARCTWTLSDRSAATKAPSWDSTLAVLGALTVAAGALGFLFWSARRGASRS